MCHILWLTVNRMLTWLKVFRNREVRSSRPFKNLPNVSNWLLLKINPIFLKINLKGSTDCTAWPLIPYHDSFHVPFKAESRTYQCCSWIFDLKKDLHSFSNKLSKHKVKCAFPIVVSKCEIQTKWASGRRIPL